MGGGEREGGVLSCIYMPKSCRNQGLVFTTESRTTGLVPLVVHVNQGSKTHARKESEGLACVENHRGGGVTKMNKHWGTIKHGMNRKSTRNHRRQDKPNQDKTSQAEPRQDKLSQDKTRQDKTRQDKTRQDKTRQDKTRQNKAKQDKPSQDKTSQAGQDKTRQDKTSQAKTRQDKTRHDKTRQDKTKQHRRRRRGDITAAAAKPSLSSLLEAAAATQNAMKVKRSSTASTQNVITGRSTSLPKNCRSAHTGKHCQQNSTGKP
jgi:hypothetical protein